MIPPAMASKAIARHLEGVGHRIGWDNSPPVLVYLMGLVIDGKAKALASLPFPAPDDMFAQNGGHVLANLGADMLNGSLRPLADKIARNVGVEFAGMAFAMEAWMGSMSPEEREGRRLADIPGSQEIRSVIVLDGAGRVVFCQRIRGQKPTVRTSEDPDVEVAGMILAGLRDITLAIGSRIPFGSVDLDAISRVGAEELTE